MRKSPARIIEGVRDAYDRIADQFSSTRAYLWDDIRPLARYAKEKNVILDIGCGNGRVYQLFEKKQGVEYSGIDISKKLLTIAQKRIPNSRFYHADMRFLPLASDSVDLIYCIAAFHHLPTVKDRLKALREMKRVLKKGGRILMTNWNIYDLRKYEKYETTKRRQEGKDFFIPWKDGTGEILGKRYYHGFTFDELICLFEKVGLTIEKQYTSTLGRPRSAKEKKNLISILRNFY